MIFPRVNHKAKHSEVWDSVRALLISSVYSLAYLIAASTGTGESAVSVEYYFLRFYVTNVQIIIIIYIIYIYINFIYYVIISNFYRCVLLTIGFQFID